MKFPAPDISSDYEYGCTATRYKYRWSGEHECMCDDIVLHIGKHVCEHCGTPWEHA